MASRSPETSLASGGVDELFYVPFEHVNRRARLVIVGITPGPNQIELSYEAAAVRLRAGVPTERILEEIKPIAAFGSPTMRPNLIRMLRHFEFAKRLGVSDVADLWGKEAALFHATSVVPHAAFRKGRMFSGTFRDVLGSKVFRESFERDFVPSLGLLPEDSEFVALGPTPLAALEWCVEESLIDRRRILGAFAHPSSGAGSQVDVYLGTKRIADLHMKDPVRKRAPWLIQASEQMRQVVGMVARLATALPTALVEDEPLHPTKQEFTTMMNPPMKPTTKRPHGLHAVVARGKYAGEILLPHVHADGKVVVSETRYEKDYVRLAADEPLEPWLRKGFRLRMSIPHLPKVAPSLILPASIRGWGHEV